MTDLEELAAAADAVADDNPDTAAAPGDPGTTRPGPAEAATARHPEQYRQHGLALSINQRFGELVGDAELPKQALFGEAAVMTLEEQVGTAAMPGHVWLTLSVLVMALVLGLRRALTPPASGPVPRQPPAALVPPSDTGSGEYAGSTVGGPG